MFLSPQHTIKQHKQAKLIADQWLEMEAIWAKINAAIEAKAQKVNAIFNFDQLSAISGEVTHDRDPNAQETTQIG
jgi:hypothetical protein